MGQDIQKADIAIQKRKSDIAIPSSLILPLRMYLEAPSSERLNNLVEAFQDFRNNQMKKYRITMSDYNDINNPIYSIIEIILRKAQFNEPVFSQVLEFMSQGYSPSNFNSYRNQQNSLLTGLITSLYNRQPFPQHHLEKTSTIARYFLKDGRTKRPSMRIPGFSAFEAEHQLSFQIFMEAERKIQKDSCEDSNIELLFRSMTKQYVHIPECDHCYKDIILREEQKRCGRCRIAFYCSKKCQSDDWQRHKKMCKEIED